MFYEAKGQVEKAEDFYHEIIKEMPTNQMISKRLVGAGPAPAPQPPQDCASARGRAGREFERKRSGSRPPL